MNRFLIFDIDYTISTFDSEAGMAELHKYLASHFGEGFTEKICTFMSRCFETFYAKGQGRDSKDIQKFEVLIKEAAKNVEGIQDFADIHWSRELWIYIASDGSLSPRSCVEAAKHFWKGIRLAMRPYGDTQNFFNWLNDPTHDHNWNSDSGSTCQTIFVTSSDARLTTNKDNLNLLYSANHSSEAKLMRVKDVIPHSPLEASIFVGDPIGKPHPEFWSKTLQSLGYNQEEDLAIMTGDSYRVDIQGVSQFGIVPVLIDRNGSTKPEDAPEAKYIIQSMEELPGIMASEEIQKQEEEAH